MGGEKTYEKEKDVIVREIELGKNYLVTCDKDGGWAMFYLMELFGENAMKEAIQKYIKKGEFVSLLQFREKVKPLETEQEIDAALEELRVGFYASQERERAYGIIKSHVSKLTQENTELREKTKNYKDSWKHHYDLSQQLQSKLDRIMEAVKGSIFTYTFEKVKYIKSILEEGEKK